MKILKIDKNNPEEGLIKKAAETLASGDLLVYPTDTTYGLGANAFNVEAVRKMYEAKGRDFSKPTHVVVKNWKMIEVIAHIDERAKKLFDAFMPGPLTIVLNKKPDVPDVLTADLPTVGVRIPDSNIAKKLSGYLDFPYTTPSANKADGRTPYSMADVKKELDTNNIDLALDVGGLPEVKPSTIIDLSSERVKILRHGPILQADIEEVLGLTLE